MPVHHGKNGKVKAGASGLVAEVTQFQVAETIKTSDTTAMGDTAETHLVGVPAWTATVDCNYDPADTTGQEVFLIGSSLTVAFYSDGDASGKKYMTGTASVTGSTVQAQSTERVTKSLSLLGNGPLSHTTVSA
ncbi:hypothetical protein [Rhizobium sp. Leaf386]|uniref:hypothetical protein n=1 Tax=Rhizobium sp. Leaf386 TaxID=1736359 RepID=UPI0007158CE1|nr:hypothetical protein [Rhizobium sp. Leaf386]KQS90301.1 hypothetical protein ASG50_07540 [Rhizobium sp. Leaf386]